MYRYYADEMPSYFLEKVAKELNISPEKLCEIVSIDVPTFNKAKTDGTFPQKESRRLIRIHELFKLAKEALYNPNVAVSWFTAPEKGLDNQIPLTMINTEIGYKEVEEFLGRMYFRKFQ